MVPVSGATTANGGATWAKVTAPNVQLVTPFSTTPATAVSTVRFANASDGWLFNPGLWQTTDGGRQWRKVGLSGDADALAVSGGEAYVSIGTPGGGFTPAKLYRSVVGSGVWTLVRGVPPQNDLTAFGHSAWAGVAPDLWTTANSGKTFREQGEPSGAGQVYQLAMVPGNPKVVTLEAAG